MGVRHRILDVNYVAGADVLPFRIVKFDTNGNVVQTAADTDQGIGAAQRVGANSGERIDIARIGIAEVEFGGTVAAGDTLTSDADGKAVATTTADKKVVGVAEIAGEAGDIGSMLIVSSVR